MTSHAKISWQRKPGFCGTDTTLSGSVQALPTANSVDGDCYLTAFVNILTTGKDFLAEILHPWASSLKGRDGAVCVCVGGAGKKQTQKNQSLLERTPNVTNVVSECGLSAADALLVCLSNPQVTRWVARTRETPISVRTFPAKMVHSTQDCSRRA